MELVLMGLPSVSRDVYKTIRFLGVPSGCLAA
jgi:hypothetical protein